MLAIRDWIKRNVVLILHIFLTFIFCIFLAVFLGAYPDYLLVGNLVLVLILVYWFYRFIFKRLYADSFLKAVCTLAMIISANQLYSYNKLEKIFPWLKSVEHSWVLIGVTVMLIVLLLIFKLLTYIEPASGVEIQIDESAVSNAKIGSANRQGIVGDGILGIDEENERKESFFSFLRFLCVLVLVCILVVIPIVLLYLFNMNELDKTDLDFDRLFTFLVSYGASFLLIFFALVIIIITLIYIAKYIYIQIRAFKKINKEDLENHYPVPTYAFSVILVCILLFFSWRISNFSLDDLTEELVHGKYLVLPIAVVVTMVLFFILVQIIHAIILLLSNMSAEVIKQFMKKILREWRIGTRISVIIGDIFDIILDTMLSALSFVKFIPDFFSAMSRMILNDDDEEDNEIEEKDSENGLPVDE